MSDKRDRPADLGRRAFLRGRWLFKGDDEDRSSSESSGPDGRRGPDADRSPGADRGSGADRGPAVERAMGPAPPCIPPAFDAVQSGWPTDTAKGERADAIGRTGKTVHVGRAGNPCVDCDAPCVESCDEDIIRRHPAEHPLAGKAYLDFSRRGCTFCGDCFEVCPLPVPRSATPTPVRIGDAILSENACIAWQGVICISCQQACGEDAVVMDGRGRPAIDPGRCTGCGMCVAPCPTDAIRVEPRKLPRRRH